MPFLVLRAAWEDPVHLLFAGALPQSARDVSMFFLLCRIIFILHHNSAIQDLKIPGYLKATTAGHFKSVI